MANIRATLETLMRATLADQAAQRTWTYRAVRPCTVPPTWHPGQPVVGDCSKGAQFLARWALAPDPMGNGYGPYGNSQTICLHLRHLPFAHDLDIGDIITFGRGGDQHAAMVLEPGTDPLLWSFGHQGAPNTYRLSQDRRTAQFLELPVQPYMPPLEQQLRAKTGWFSWVAWRLGEGDWIGYGTANGNVRPNVPKVIPLGWWIRLAEFLANRRKGDKAPTA